MVMVNAWDRPPFAKRGSAERVLYEAIGRALMDWEEVEGGFAFVYSAFLTGSRFNTKANRRYGAPANFAQRVDGLKTVACRYFQKNCSQQVEGEFDELVRLSIGWSNRRNDIAHGRARPSQWVIEPDPAMQDAFRWCIVPAHFRAEKFPDNIPAYVLSSREIRRFGVAFRELSRRVSDFAYRIEVQQRA